MIAMSAMQQNLNKLTTGNEHEDKARLAALENYPRHPDDAAARREYKRTLEAEKLDPKRRLAVAEIENGVEQSQKAERVDTKKNLTTLAENDGKVVDNDSKITTNACVGQGRRYGLGCAE